MTSLIKQKRKFFRKMKSKDKIKNVRPLIQEAKNYLSPMNDSNEPNWTMLRVQMAENFMASMLNADESIKMKLIADVLYKELAAFSVKCADALIEELKK